ncbi:uncharacterized protein LOC130675734 [Microplitis mediator]|uniref:uncharacterized protein LOC130675734 n=1 Tax=Microplitis mediator TaxID=375433 RepID=UPI00255787BB|nr:uncharacterized protein LOC130675734 [Microplitis mediator]
MDIFDAPYYRIMKNSAKLIGQWPYQSREKRIIIIIIVWAFFFMQFIPQIIAIVMHIDEPDILFEACSNMAVDLLTAIKYINAISKTNLIKKLHDRIISDWRLMLNDKEKITLEKHANLGYIFSSGWAGFAYMSATIFVLEPVFPRILNVFISVNETDPFKLALPLEYIIIDREKHYWIMLFVSTIFVYNIIIVLVSCDIMYITFVQHVCGLFAVVGCRLENTPIDKNYLNGHKRGDDLPNSDDLSYRHLVSCIRSHRRALEYADLLESAYSLSFGLVVGINLPLISITGFQIITQSNTVEQLLKYASFTISQILHLFFECFMSQRLTDMSLHMHHSIAKVKWFHNSIKSRKLLLIMMMRSQVPCKLTAAKIMDLTIENFAAMVKTSGSYFTMLLSIGLKSYVNLKPSETGDIITMDIFDEPYYRVVKTSSHLIGQWPYQSPQKKVMITMIIWTAFFMQFIPQVIAIVMHLDDPDILFESFSSMVIDLVFIFKYFNAISKAHLMKKLYNRIVSDWKSLLNDEEKSRLQHHTNLGRLFSSGYAGFAYMSVVIFIMEPVFPRIINAFIKTNETVPFKLALPLEYIIIDREKHYWLMLAISNLLVVNITVVIISCDITFITFVQHVCGLFAVVGCRLVNTPINKNYSERHKGGDYLSNSKDIPYKHLVSCIRSHRRALEFAELLENAYCVSFGLTIGLNLPVISVTGFQIITQSNTIQQLLKYVSFTITEILHLFFECFMSQQLTDMSLQIQDSIAQVKWFNNSIKSRKLLILMTMRSQVPCKLTAAKIMDLSIENFGMMVKTSGSYFTMLLSTR